MAQLIKQVEVQNFDLKEQNIKLNVVI